MRSRTNLRDRIIANRKRRIASEGHSLGAEVPPKREFPVIPFIQNPLLVCEVKRRSPSKGGIAPGLESVDQAALYVQHGVRCISVLTEPDFFQGSLDDLIGIKRRFPEIALLRKDFLIDEEDIVASFHAGADAVLLIASALDSDRFGILYEETRRLGLQALVELHDEDDIARVRDYEPPLIGINSRDLATFKVDLTHPLRLRGRITWPSTKLFESGILTQEHARFALSSGFDGVLVGEAVVRDPQLTKDLHAAFEMQSSDFWGRLFARRSRPLLKICGITNEPDARLAVELGADMLGFVFAESPRRADPTLLRRIADLDTLKVAVITDSAQEIKELMNAELIDAVQFHGSESPQECYATAFPYFKAVRIKSEVDIEHAATYRCPRVLIDSFSAAAVGGTGTRIPPELIAKARERSPLWLAGGLAPENVRETIERYQPELLDASSRLEEAPGKKDPKKLRRYFAEAGRSAVQAYNDRV